MLLARAWSKGHVAKLPSGLRVALDAQGAGERNYPGGFAAWACGFAARRLS